MILLIYYSYEQNVLRQTTNVNETPGQVCIVTSVSCHHIVLVLCDIKKI